MGANLCFLSDLIKNKKTASEKAVVIMVKYSLSFAYGISTGGHYLYFTLTFLLTNPHTRHAQAAADKFVVEE